MKSRISSLHPFVDNLWVTTSPHPAHFATQNNHLAYRIHPSGQNIHVAPQIHGQIHTKAHLTTLTKCACHSSRPRGLSGFPEPLELRLHRCQAPAPGSLWITRQSRSVFSQLTMLNNIFASHHKFDYSRTPERVLRLKHFRSRSFKGSIPRH